MKQLRHSNCFSLNIRWIYTHSYKNQLCLASSPHCIHWRAELRSIPTLNPAPLTHTSWTNFLVRLWTLFCLNLDEPPGRLPFSFKACTAFSTPHKPLWLYNSNPPGLHSCSSLCTPISSTTDLFSKLEYGFVPTASFHDYHALSWSTRSHYCGHPHTQPGCTYYRPIYYLCIIWFWWAAKDVELQSIHHVFQNSCRCSPL